MVVTAEQVLAMEDSLFDTGPRVLDSRFLSVWIYFATGWKHLAWHSTGVPG